MSIHQIAYDSPSCRLSLSCTATTRNTGETPEGTEDDRVLAEEDEELQLDDQNTHRETIVVVKTTIDKWTQTFNNIKKTIETNKSHPS